MIFTILVYQAKQYSITASRVEEIASCSERRENFLVTMMTGIELIGKGEE
jgi:flagellar basal body P-ring protein FlgI